MKSDRQHAIELTILSDEAKQIKQALEAKEDKLTSLPIAIVQCETSPDEIDVERVTVLLADPDLAAQIVHDCDNLIWCQSTWAGNAPLLRAEKKDYVLTGLKGVFGKLMREYVFAYLLHHARNISTFEKSQSASPPIWEASPRLPLHGQTLGILGVGSIGQALIPVAHAFGMRVIGLSRSGRTVEGVEKVYTPNEISEFAQSVDHVVNLMPDTAQTHNMVSYDLLNHLKPYSIFINAGRGSAVDEEALIQCLNQGTLAHAVLDVFQQEPLPAEHSFWKHPKISVTAHTAAESAPSDVADVFLENASRFVLGKPLLHQFNFEKGY